MCLGGGRRCGAQVMTGWGGGAQTVRGAGAEWKSSAVQVPQVIVVVVLTLFTPYKRVR